MNHELFICDCDAVNHHIIFSDDGEDIYMSVHLSPLSFKDRIKKAIRYIFNCEENYGHYDVVLLKPKDSYRLQKIVDKLKEYGSVC